MPDHAIPYLPIREDAAEVIEIDAADDGVDVCLNHAVVELAISQILGVLRERVRD